MGSTLNDERTLRPIVALKRITYPDGRRLTRSLIRFDTEQHSYNPETDVINNLLPIIDSEYEKLVEESKKKSLVDSLDGFLNATSDVAIVGDGLIAALATDLEKDPREISAALMNTKWLSSMLAVIKRQFRKSKKENPIRYAESVRHIVDVFGLHASIRLLSTNGINLKRSALTYLCRIANETPKIKSLIRDDQLKLTVAFELPNVEEAQREKIAEQLAAFKTYGEQKNFLRELKECQ